MLKYLYDNNKKDRFINFWGLKELEEWDDFSKNEESVFLKFFQLKKHLLTTIYLLIEKTLEEEQASLKQNWLVFNPINSKKKGEAMGLSPHLENEIDNLKELDDLNFILFEKSNPLNHISNNEWQWQTWIKSILEKIPFFLDKKNIFQYFKKDSSPPLDNLNPNEKKKLKELYHQFALSRGNELNTSDYSNQEIKKQFPDELIVNLKIKNSLLFFFLKTPENFSPYILVNYYNPKINTFLNNQKEFKSLQLNKVPLHQWVLGIDKYLYENKTKNRLTALEINLREEQLLFLKEITKLIIKKNETANYLNNSFLNKLLFVLKNFYPEYLILLTEIKKIGLEKPFPIMEITHLIKEISFENPQTKNLNKESPLMILKELNRLGILFIQDKQIIFNPEIIQIFKEKTPAALAQPSLKKEVFIIDIDMSIIAYKDNLDEEILYRLTSFCKIKTHPHLLQIEIDANLSTFAWFLNLTHESIYNFFDQFKKESIHSGFNEYLKLFFENCSLFKQKIYYGLSIPSTVEFKKIKYLIEEKNLNEEVDIIEKKRTIIFYQYNTYKTFIEDEKIRKKLF